MSRPFLPKSPRARAYAAVHMDGRTICAQGLGLALLAACGVTLLSILQHIC